MPFCFILNNSPSCHTLSKAFERSRKRALVSSCFSKALYISVVIAVSWLIVESPGMKPDWLGVIRLLVERKLNRSSYIIFSNILLQMQRREIGR